MKRLMMILVVAGMFSAGLADAVEHSALSNVFTLDTRRTPMQHSALSNIFTLDTRDVVPSLEVAMLSPDPNPQASQVMEGGAAYRYYRAVDSDGEGVSGVAPVLEIDGKLVTGEVSDEYGLLKLAVNTKDLARPGDTLAVKLVKLGQQDLSSSQQITFQVQVTPREYTKYWDDGTKIGGKIGLSAGGHVYLTGRSEAGMSVGISETDPHSDDDDQVIMTRRGSGALGAGAGVETPGVKFNIGGVARGKVGAGASAELLVLTLKEDEYLFDHPYESRQKMGQAVLLLHHITTLGGRIDPFVMKMIKAVLGVTDEKYYIDHRTSEMAGLGIEASAGAEAGAGLGFGFGSIDNPNESGMGIGIEAGLGATVSASAQYLKYYQGQTVTGTGIALDQYVDIDLVPISITAGVFFGGKNDTSGSLGRKWEPLRMGKAKRFTEELVWNAKGDLIQIIVSISGEERTQTYVIEGEENIEATKTAAKNLINLVMALSEPGAAVVVGPERIKEELTNFLIHAAQVQVYYEVVRKPTRTQTYPFSLEGSLGVKAGFEIDVTLSQHVDAISERGVVIRGWEFPLESYGTHPESDKEYSVIMENVLSGTWEMIKDKFQQVVEVVEQGIEKVIEATAETVDSMVRLVGKFEESVVVVLRVWAPDEQPYFQPAPSNIHYARALQQATSPIIGAYYQFTPEGAALAEPGSLEISYTDEEVRKYGINESNLRISYWDVENSRWVSVGGTVNKDNNTVRASIRELHLFAITFDATPPDIGQLAPAPDSVITNPETTIQARIVDDTNQLDNSSIVFTLDDVEVFYIFDGASVTHVPTDLSVGKHNVTVKASDLFGNTAEQTWSFTLPNPEAAPWDVNGDGVVDIFDLVLVGNAFGTSGEGLPADVNSDGVVDILDLATVAAHFGEATSLSAPAVPKMPDSLHLDMLERWLTAARIADDGSETFRRGIAVLERLLSEIVPDQTALLHNYPNPFNPDTWIPYQLSEASNVSITIYAATGRVVKRLDLGNRPAGTYRTRARAAHWDGRNEVGEPVASGVYFVVFKAGDYQQARRIALLK